MIELIIIALAALVCEWIDSSLGMGYGTILTPSLLLAGFSPLEIVPAVLITQAFGGFSAAVFHHHQGNANFSFKSKSEDMKTVLAITSLGIVAVIVAAMIGTIISKTVLSTYIGILVIIMGLLILLNFRFVYSTFKMVLVGIVSAFNKGLSGGGFGPLVTGGQIVLGKEHKSAIACTTAAEPLICIAGFITYFLINGISSYGLIIALGIGSIIAGPLGAITTKKISREKLRKIVGFLLVILGTLNLLKLFGFISLNISM